MIKYKEKLVKLVKNAYTPYSGFNVAAIIKFDDGSEYNGVNVENISYGASICAERSAYLSGISNGKKNNKIEAIYLYSESVKDINVDITYPCGICKQTLSEFTTPNTKLITFNKKGEFKEILFDDINQYAFKK